MQRGRLLEPVAVQMLRERFPRWKIEHNAAENVYYVASANAGSEQFAESAADLIGRDLRPVNRLLAAKFPARALKPDAECGGSSEHNQHGDQARRGARRVARHHTSRRGR